jgi:2-polyprenyl-3-methyl-5-hydroxy-6-metoxy-1,4-benzoquinol methylase
MEVSTEDALYEIRLRRFNNSWWWKEVAGMLLWTSPARADLVVDIGCGLGTFCKRVKKSLPDSMVVGIEPNEHLAGLASESVQSGVAIVKGDGEAVRHYSGVDWVTCIHAISHVESPERLVSAIWMALRPGGRATFVVPNKIFDQLMRPKNWITRYEGDSTIKHQWTPKQFCQMLRRLGFTTSSFAVGEKAYGIEADWAHAWVVVHAVKPEIMR